jgi:acyl phosphate:glycerol-3-phosphate acyltransferase
VTPEPTIAWSMWAACAAGAYVVGSVPFGLIIGRARGIDIRQHGSKNIGATNVGRVLGRKWGYLCFGLDVLKGALPVLAAGIVMNVLGERAISPGTLMAWLGVAVCAVLGHVFPMWLKFKGGKGVATGFGSLVAVFPWFTWPALVAMALWVVVVRATRFVSVASIVAAGSIPISAGVLAVWNRDGTLLHRVGPAWPVLAVGTVLAGLVVWKHRANIARLRAGTEPRIGETRVIGRSPK